MMPGVIYRGEAAPDPRYRVFQSVSWPLSVSALRFIDHSRNS